MGRPTLAANQRGPPRAPWARPTPRFWAQPKPLLTWKWLSYETWEAGYRKTIEKESEIIPGSATFQAMAGDRLPSRGYFQTGSTAPAWFPFAKGSWQDVILIEQAITLGRFGVLTFLYPEAGKFPWIHD